MKRRSIVWTLALLTAAVVGIWARQQMAIESRDQPATADDLRILRRADALLGDASVWNRHDDRVCDDDEASGKRSLFCALQKADREILGEYQHRNVALQEVRFVIQDATRDRPNRDGDSRAPAIQFAAPAHGLQQSAGDAV